MQSKATTPQQYIDEADLIKKPALIKLRETILANLPKGFEEAMGYGMMGYVVPHTIYPAGYHCDPKQPLPFMGMAAQKHSVNFYHMGIMANPALHDWFVAEYKKQVKSKLDMGKSCIRFKKLDEIPYQLIGELVAKVSVQDWVSTYERVFKR